jgi:hypothetical protein
VAEDEQLKSALRIVIALLCLGAAILLVKIFTADGFDNPDGAKAFETAIALAFISLAVGAGIHLIGRQPGMAAVGYLTILVGIVALLLTANLIWREGNFLEEVTTSERWAWYTLIGTIALGILSTLLAGHDDFDADSVKLVRGMTVFALFGLFVAVIVEVSVSGQRVNHNLLGSLSVFYVLGSLVLPLLSRITR